MSYQPGYSEVVPPMVGTATSGWSPSSSILALSGGAPTSAAWESAARVVYFPILVLALATVRRVWWANGATVSGGATVEVGIYRDTDGKPGAKIISGSATQGSANVVQFVDVTDTALAPGRYWLALMMSSATNTTIFRKALLSSYDAALRFQEAAANPLPATATPVESSSVYWYLFGFATTASP